MPPARRYSAPIWRKPIVVVSNNDGCIISLSREAKQFGIKMGEPYFKFKEKLFPSRVYVFSSNYALYADLSSRVMQTLTDLAPAIEIYSIDEAFVNVSGSATACRWKRSVTRCAQRSLKIRA
jgi:DNA polymerase V